MKIKSEPMAYEQVLALPAPEHKAPRRPGVAVRTLVRVLSEAGLMGSSFSYTMEGMEKIGKDEPCLILMNHSCFLDLMMVSKIFYPKPYCIVCTSDGFVGKEGLMRAVGCIPTRKFVTDLGLVQDLEDCLKRQKTSVLMYPEASYSFDGTATPLPRKLGVLVKKLGVSVVTIRTTGAFTRNPLYNELKVRKSVPVSAAVRCLFTREEVQSKSTRELTEGVEAAFIYDHFRWQKEAGITVRDPFRADGLNRILYQCAACGAEGKMVGKGTTLRCGECGKVYTLTPLGELEAETGETEFSHIPDWYAWERREIRRQLENGTYRLDVPVDIAVMRDYRAIYTVGQGRLTHDANGFCLTGCEGKLHYTQGPLHAYGLYADYYWYERGDVICIGGSEILYYCFPRGTDVAARTRLAAEELYKLCKKKGKRSNFQDFGKNPEEMGRKVRAEKTLAL